MVHFILWHGINVYLHVGRQWRMGGGGGSVEGEGGEGEEEGWGERGRRRLAGREDKKEGRSGERGEKVPN